MAIEYLSPKSPERSHSPRGGLRAGGPVSGWAVRGWGDVFDFRKDALWLPCNTRCIPVPLRLFHSATCPKDVRGCPVFGIFARGIVRGISRVGQWIGTGLEMSWIALALVVWRESR